VNGIVKQLATKPGQWLFILEITEKVKGNTKYESIF